MTVQEMMERSGLRDTTLAIAWMKDAMNLFKSSVSEIISVDKQNIIDGEREYILPSDMVNLKTVSVLDTSDNKYKKIRRLAFDPVVTEDTDPE